MTNIIEAILFASGEAVEVDIFREKLQVSKIEMDKAIRKLENKYSGDNGIYLLHFNHKLQMATNPEYKDAIASVLTPIREKEFTATILECAAIIAYKQPITRTDLEKIRNGRSSDYAITTLMTLDMIEPVGRKDTPGKPVLYGTTDSFLKRFKLRSINELPDYEEFLRKLADIHSWEALKPADDEGYLYEKEEYNPEEDADLTQDIPTDETSEIEE
ncbi:MAG: SMC-Scp complex subunit ScpB [Clostridia bacterium]|nr:SMC-Scp complex subunit ScpB [Clostridia bacterium]